MTAKFGSYDIWEIELFLFLKCKNWLAYDNYITFRKFCLFSNRPWSIFFVNFIGFLIFWEVSEIQLIWSKMVAVWKAGRDPTLCDVIIITNLTRIIYYQTSKFIFIAWTLERTDIAFIYTEFHSFFFCFLLFFSFLWKGGVHKPLRALQLWLTMKRGGFFIFWVKPLPLNSAKWADNVISLQFFFFSNPQKTVKGD